MWDSVVIRLVVFPVYLVHLKVQMVHRRVTFVWPAFILCWRDPLPAADAQTSLHPRMGVNIEETVLAMLDTLALTEKIVRHVNRGHLRRLMDLQDA